MDYSKETILNELDEMYKSFSKNDLLEEYQKNFNEITEQINTLENTIITATIVVSVITLICIICLFVINSKLTNSESKLLKIKRRMLSKKKGIQD